MQWWWKGQVVGGSAACPALTGYGQGSSAEIWIASDSYLAVVLWAHCGNTTTHVVCQSYYTETLQFHFLNAQAVTGGHKLTFKYTTGTADSYIYYYATPNYGDFTTNNTPWDWVIDAEHMPIYDGEATICSGLSGCSYPYPSGDFTPDPAGLTYTLEQGYDWGLYGIEQVIEAVVNNCRMRSPDQNDVNSWAFGFYAGIQTETIVNP